MIRQRKHPDVTWTAPYETHWLDDSEFDPLDQVTFAGGEGGTYTFRQGSACFRIRVCQSGILRCSLAPDGVMPEDGQRQRPSAAAGIINDDLDTPDHTVRHDGNQVLIATSCMRTVITLDPFTLEITTRAGERLLHSPAGGISVRRTTDGHETLAFFDKSEQDHFFGFGGRIHRPERTGSTVDLFATKVFTERGDYGGFPLPYFLSTQGYGFLLDNPWPHVYFDMGREFRDRWFVHTPGGFLDFYVLAGPSFADITKKYCTLTGFPVLPDKWQLGFWVSWSIPFHRIEDYLYTAERLRTEQWPFDVMVVDMHWRGGDFNLFLEGGRGCNLEWHLDRFGDGRDLLRLLHDKNAHLALHLNTSMYTGDLLENGLENGGLRYVADDIIVPRVTAPEGIDWYWKTHKPRADEGVDLWWTDNGERVDGTLACGLPSRNLFGHLWNNVLFDKMKADGHGNRLVLSRGGWLGAQRFTLTWPGDTAPGVHRFKEDLWWHLNCSVSGIPYNTVDFGGFCPLNQFFQEDGREGSYRHKTMHCGENIVRRVAHAMLLFTIPRVHGPAKLPWMYHEKVQRAWRFFLELRYRMFPYIYSNICHAVSTGEPPYRPLVWHYPDDPEAIRVDDQILCGEHLLMAPGVEEEVTEREVYLPEGSWVDFWTGERFSGRRHVIAEAPFFEPRGVPLFVRQGAVIPMRPLCQYNSEDHERELCLHLFPAAEGRQRLQDAPDLGYTVAHRRAGDVLEIEVTNPLSVERRIHLVTHGPRLAGATANAAVTAPFEKLTAMTLDLAPNETLRQPFPLLSGQDSIEST